jgi:hypothetical protein
MNAISSNISSQEQAVLTAAKFQAQTKSSNDLSRVAAWKTRIIDALSFHNATFTTATLQLSKVLDSYKAGIKAPEDANQAQINTANTAEQSFMEYKPVGGKLTIQELIQTFVDRAQVTYSETATGLSTSYIASIVRDKDNITNQQIHTLLTELVAERIPTVIESRLEIITNADLLIKKLENTPLKNWFEVINSNDNISTAIDLIEKNARAINALVINNDNPDIGNTLSFGHMPVEVVSVLGVDGKPTQTPTRPLQELQLAALLSFMVRQHFDTQGQQDIINQLESEGTPLLDASQLRNMSLHNIDFKNNPDLAVFTFAVSYLLGLSPGLGDCRVCDLINPVKKLPSPEKIPGFLRVALDNPDISENINSLLGGQDTLESRLTSVKSRLASAQV